MDMNDYSGTFRPDPGMTDFSREALVRMRQVAGMMYSSLAGNYQRVMREKLGEKAAQDLDAEVWRPQTPVEVLDGEGFQDAAALFHPRMKARPLKLPPRGRKTEPACRWEFRAEHSR